MGHTIWIGIAGVSYDVNRFKSKVSKPMYPWLYFVFNELVYTLDGGIGKDSNAIMITTAEADFSTAGLGGIHTQDPHAVYTVVLHLYEHLVNVLVTVSTIRVFVACPQERG